MRACISSQSDRQTDKQDWVHSQTDRIGDRIGCNALMARVTNEKLNDH